MEIMVDRLKIDIIDEHGHVYWSTHCRHDNHDARAATEFAPGVPRQPGQCKTCAAPCVCDCHKEENMPESDQVEWKRASACADGASCVEVAFVEGAVMMRASGEPSEVIFIPMPHWLDFIDAIGRGEFNTPEGVDNL